MVGAFIIEILCYAMRTLSHCMICAHVHDELIIACKEDIFFQGGKAMVTRTDRIQIFQDTMNWIQSNPALSASVKRAKQNTTVFYEDDYPQFDASIVKFANAFHAGGGVTKGSSAQEESLCRCSTRYPLLYRRTLRDTFYKHHHNLNTPIGVDGCKGGWIDKFNVREQAKKLQCKADDIVDAICQAITANLDAENMTDTIPEDLQKDEKGLFMQMVIPKASLQMRSVKRRKHCLMRSEM